MDTNSKDPSGLDGIPLGADDWKETPVDYIVVGSGAGGGPLAARLALAGMKVLVLEAGVDPGAPLPTSRATENEHAAYYCPGLHGASTEPHEHFKTDPADPVNTSWGFDVRHYRNPARPASYYPRSSNIGGCTAHNAMITIYGVDSDWQDIADLTGDKSWAPAKMRAIYQRIERCRTGILVSRLYYYWQWFLRCLNPARDATGGRGEGGWLDVTMTDPKQVMADRPLMNVILKTVVDTEELTSGRAIWRWMRRVFGGTLFRDLDLNDARTMRESPEGAALVPLNITREGVRRGPREHLLETRLALAGDPDPTAGKLYIATGIFVTRVVFDCQGGGVPRAVGVEYRKGRHLYEASPFYQPSASGDLKLCFARREIVLCGGAFNTPQILMLSGVGDPAQLRDKAVDVRGLACVEKVDGRWVATTGEKIIDLPGVGRNLRDRCEISVISEMAEPFASLEGVTFDPNANTDPAAGPVDPALAGWMAEKSNKPRTGLFRTNGAALAILKRSKKEILRPDLLLLGFPVAFRGYYRGWSKHLLTREKEGTEKIRNLWTWVILKAFSNNSGIVRLRSKDPSKMPEITFGYFGERQDPASGHWKTDDNDSDLDALQGAVGVIRKMNRNAAKYMKGGDPAIAEVQPGSALPTGSPALRDWIVNETWGHHAAGTCRIGADPWRAKTSDLRDKEAVLDSRFRVHGVRGLRVADASVFPKLPGYFIAVPIFMIGEKAANTIIDELSS